MLTLSLLLTCLVKTTAIGVGLHEGSCLDILPFLFNFSLAAAEVEGIVEAGSHFRPRLTFVLIGKPRRKLAHQHFLAGIDQLNKMPRFGLLPVARPLPLGDRGGGGVEKRPLAVTGHNAP